MLPRSLPLLLLATIGALAAVHAVAEAAPPQAPEVVLWKTTADLDGDGRAERIALTTRDAETTGARAKYEGSTDTIAVPACTGGAVVCTVRLEVGTATHDLEITPGYFGAVDVRVIDIDRKARRRALLVRTNGGDGEDPPFHASIVFYTGRALRAVSLADRVQSWLTDGEVTTDGNRQLTVRYSSCPDEITVRFRVDGDRLRERSRRTRRVHALEDCSACPHVYVVERGEARYRGEILRDLDHPTLRATQPLALGSLARFAEDGVLVIELREEKAETTYLDAVHLEIDGEELAPLDCPREAAWCAGDGRHHVLRRGDVLRLRFPLGARSAAARLVATGYYVPDP